MKNTTKIEYGVAGKDGTLIARAYAKPGICQEIADDHNSGDLDYVLRPKQIANKPYRVVKITTTVVQEDL